MWAARRRRRGAPQSKSERKGKMTRNLKALGLALVAVLAVSAMAASAAQAESEKGTFTAGVTPSKHTTSTLHGKQIGVATENFFSINEGKEEVTCTNSGVSFTSILIGGTATKLTVAPTYTECLSSGFLPTTVNTNECDYTFTQPETILDAGGPYTGKADLFCPAGQKIEIDIYLEGKLHEEATYKTKLCHIEVFPKTGEEQELGGHIFYANNKEVEVTTGVKKDDVTVGATIEGIHWKRSGLCGAKEGDDGVYKNKFTVTGTSPLTQHQDVWISDPASP
jgi:hypothetical protein